MSLFASIPCVYGVDSIGRRIENGKIVILHKVESKQTVYAISKIYNVSESVIYNDNPTAKEALKVGQILKIRTEREEITPKYTASATTTSTHTVAPKETLYAISKIYNVSIEDIKKWNNLINNELSTGQELKINSSTPIQTNTTPINTVPKPTQNGKTHTVALKETLYSISKIYNVSIDDLKSTNKLTSNELSTGQILVIPASKPQATTPVAAKKDNTNFNPNSKFHTVEKGETLFGISNKYNVEINDIAEWNNLTSNNLTEGQMLIINGVNNSSSSSALDALNAVNKEEKASYNQSNTINTTPKNTATPILKEKYQVDENHAEQEKVQQALALSQQKLQKHTQLQQQYEQSSNNTSSTTNTDRDHWKIPSNVSTYEDTIKYGILSKKTNVGEFKKTVETGICELITDNHWDLKYNALHPSAPIGTIIQVFNPENEISIFVRVVGRLVETVETKGDVIKISHHAVERLAPNRTRFPVQISYLP